MEFPRDFGPYRLLKQIAMGGMAEIVQAKTSGFGGFEKLLALKMIHPKFSRDEHFINMLIEEAKICVELDHVNIGQVFDLGKLGDTYFISMEFVEGSDIFRIMRRATEIDYDIPLETCAHIGQEICAGLDYAHNRRDSEGRPLGIIHRDMSPQNVMISYAGEVKIVDFGIAKAGLRAKQTEVGVIKGKYYYMSPEQAWGDPVDHRTDIFSAAIIIYEMLTGQMLYLEDNIEVLLNRVRKAEIAPPSTLRREIPRELDDILMKALAKNASDRYQSAQDLGHELRSFIYGFSPDYTSARLASMLGWLFDDEAHEARKVEEKPADASLLLTRNDFSHAPKKNSGSLLFELSDLQEIAEPLIERSREDRYADATLDAGFGGEDFMDEDPTSQVSLPDLLPDLTARIETSSGSTDATMRLDLSGDHLGPFVPQDTNEVGGWDDDERTYVETADELIRHFQDPTQNRHSAPAAPKGRQAHEVTRQLDKDSLADIKPPPSNSQRSSYIPPPPPPDGSARPSTPYRPPLPGRPSSPPSPMVFDEDPTNTDPRQPEVPAVNRPPKRPSLAPALDRPSSSSFKPSPPPAGPPRQPSRPPPPIVRRDEDLKTSAASRPSRPAPPPPPRPSSRSPSRPSQPPGLPGPDETRQTAMIPEALQLNPSVHEPTGQTTLASVASSGRETGRSADSLPTFDQPGGETNPTVVLPSSSVSAGPSTAPQFTRELPGDQRRSPQPPAPPRATGAPSSPQLSGAGQPGPRQPEGQRPLRQTPPPWLLGGDGFAASSRPPSPDLPPEPIDEGLLTAPPELQDVLAMRKQASPLRKFRKVLLPAAGVLVVAAAILLLWPSPAPVVTLDVRSHPPGAQVYIDGEQLTAVTPTKVTNLEMGTVHQIELRREGFTPWSQMVQLNAVEVRQIAVLSPIRGTLRVTSEPAGATVIIDGIYQGSTPLEIEGLDINREAQVQVRYEDQTQTKTLLWHGQTEATLEVPFENRERRRRYR